MRAMHADGSIMKKLKPTNILIGIIFTLFFISIGVIAAVNFRFIYYFDINYLDIPSTSGYDVETIIENYDALIDYNSPFFKGSLEFPSLPSSKEGLQHFVEVKNIFVSFYGIFGVTLLLLIAIVIYKAKKKDTSYLLVSSITVLVLPIIILLGCAINFDAAFVLFHKIFFRNDFWLFDPTLDPIINILPDTFFLHSLIVIVFFVLLGSLSLYLASYMVKKGKH
jgi:integral membrane protein (TIGR01906 family)